jgi:hypothetical protein
LHCKMWRFQRLRRVAWKHFFRVILQMFQFHPWPGIIELSDLAGKNPPSLPWTS